MARNPLLRTLLGPVLLLALAACDKAQGQAEAGQPEARQAEAAQADPAYLATAVGRVDSASEARQLVAPADGVIARVAVRRGDHVRAGQVLVTVSCAPRMAEARARMAEARRQAAAAATLLAGSRGEEIEAANQAVLAARATRDDAAERLEQARALIARGFVSRRELAARTNVHAAAQAALQAGMARSHLVSAGPRASERREALAAADAASGAAEAAGAMAEQCNLRSPIDGDILQVFRREGEFSGASQGAALVAIGDLGQLIVRAEVNEADAAAIRMGQRTDVWIEGGPRRWPGHVDGLARIMGRRSARSLDPTDRFDRDVLEAIVRLDGSGLPPLVGLRVLVGIRP